ncbi:hypothetical protein PMM47T1_10330 [Pseudomonas sp. M47T1]|uniref:hypothetical protein n=1 Tax=Pseudomonas sp. M47T1 TaxID=1179778 RepID=UPI000260757D|nr:hypothetical protein [Pseudomonas sp. M47T1]EIK96663.1 hypothetical protein PMM47T1_10330 [Pseudomonas sp. M47T1]
MTPERFDHLADAYGADVRRWPAQEQAAARALLDSGDVQAHAALAQASWLDGMLDSHRLAAVDPALARHIAACAPLPSRPSFWQGHRAWWSRLGLVGVGLAGIAAGMLAASLSLPLGNGAEALPSIFDQNDAEIVYSISAEDSEQ